MTEDTRPARHLWAILIALLTLGSAACSTSEPDLVVYCAHDQEHAEPLLRRFERETGLRIDIQFDAEANKTVGLVARLRQEAAHTRCDVFWNNEAAHSAALAEDGLLEPYASPNAGQIPDRFKDPLHRWTGFAARARVLIVNTQRADPAAIQGWKDVLDPRWKRQTALARPLTGTTLTHFAALGLLRGEPALLEFARDLQQRNAAGELDLASGNAVVMRLVREGRLAFGWTDTDDFNVAREDGFPVAQVVPDQNGEGCLLIPNSVAILKGAPHPDAARRLVDFLLSAEVEQELANSRSAQIPLRLGVPRPSHVLDPSKIHCMQIDYRDVGRSLSSMQSKLQAIFLQ
jgi:iron(III) transport system substrate-binding protein